MTAKEYAREMRRRVQKIEQAQLVGRTAATVVASQSKRIFEDGKATNGSIGKYNSTKPLYVDPSTAPRKFTPKGKTGKLGKTGYFKSYKDFRQSQGRQTQFVDLKLTGTMQKDFPKISRITDLRYERKFSNKLNEKKAAGNEDHFNTVIFDATKKEIEQFKTIIGKEITKLLQGD